MPAYTQTPSYRHYKCLLELTHSLGHQLAYSPIFFLEKKKVTDFLSSVGKTTTYREPRISWQGLIIYFLGHDYNLSDTTNLKTEKVPAQPGELAIFWREMTEKKVAVSDRVGRSRRRLPTIARN